MDSCIGETKLSTPDSKVEELSQKVGRNWPVIGKARQTTKAQLGKIRKALAKDEKLDSLDRSIVAFGSIARDECTSGSDLDWTLLIDGFAAATHLEIAQAITARFNDARIKPPSPSGAFGNLTFSHDLIHQIGGENDTNRNTTQRILLLLESLVIGQDHDAYERVIRGILNRYLEEDTSFLTPSKYKVPRFLLNDVVRFWRTMAVDFASKQRERAGQGWALRNVKLRMSRKLIFASGLLICFSCYLQPSEVMKNVAFRPGEPFHPLVNHLRGFIGRTPLDIVADAFLSYNVPAQAAIKLFDAYDEFLGIIGDEAKRTELEDLNSSEAQRNPTFERSRRVGHQFQEALTALFFDHPGLSELTREYGVF